MTILESKKWYPLEITEIAEKMSNNGYQMVNIKCVVVEHPKYNGTPIWHNVVFLPKESKGAGIAIHFLKSIGQPWEGTIQVDPQAWEGKRFMGYVTDREYGGKKYSQISQVSPIKEEYADPFAG